MIGNNKRFLRKTDAYALGIVLRGLFRSGKPFSRLMNGMRFLLGRHEEHVAHHPLEYQLDITYRCNLSCNTCFLRRQDYPMDGRNDMTLEDIRRILKKADGAVAILLGGGEPLLHPDVGRMITIIVGQGFYCSLSTNGLLLIERGEEIVQAGLHSANVSLDGHDAETYEAVRNAPAIIWEKLLKSIQTFRRMLDNQGLRKFQFRCNFTLTRNTVSHLKEMIRFAEEMRFDLIYFNNINSFGEPGLTLYDDDEEVQEIMQDVVRTCLPASQVYLPVLVNRSSRGFCRDPFALTILTSAGLQGRCCFDLPKKENGNFFIDETPFNSYSYLSLRKVFLDEGSSLPLQCRHCYRRFDRSGEGASQIHFDVQQSRWLA